jgi:hypothetical protein
MGMTCHYPVCSLGRRWGGTCGGKTGHRSAVCLPERPRLCGGERGTTRTRASSPWGDGTFWWPLPGRPTHHHDRARRYVRLIGLLQIGESRKTATNEVDFRGDLRTVGLLFAKNCQGQAYENRDVVAFDDRQIGLSWVCLNNGKFEVEQDINSHHFEWIWSRAGHPEHFLNVARQKTRGIHTALMFGRRGPVVVLCQRQEGGREHFQNVCRVALPVRDGKDRSYLPVLLAGKGERIPPRGSRCIPPLCALNFRLSRARKWRRARGRTGRLSVCVPFERNCRRLAPVCVGAEVGILEPRHIGQWPDPPNQSLALEKLEKLNFSEK